MPVLMITADEIAVAILTRMDELSRQVLDMSDLAMKPLNPGESPDARRHLIARAGKQLAEACQELATLMRHVAEHHASQQEPAPVTVDPNTQSN